MGHHHHHHGGGGFRQKNFFGRPGMHGASVAPSWAMALGLAAVLFAYGAIDGIATYRSYFHGERGVGVVTHVADRITTLEVNGHVCAVSGTFGRVGQVIPVAYSPGMAGSCVVRDPSSFRWPAGAMFVSRAIAIGIFLFRRGSAPTTA